MLNNNKKKIATQYSPNKNNKVPLNANGKGIINQLFAVNDENLKRLVKIIKKTSCINPNPHKFPNKCTDTSTIAMVSKLDKRKPFRDTEVEKRSQSNFRVRNQSPIFGMHPQATLKNRSVSPFQKKNSIQIYTKQNFHKNFERLITDPEEIDKSFTSLTKVSSKFSNDPFSKTINDSTYLIEGSEHANSCNLIENCDELVTFREVKKPNNLIIPKLKIPNTVHVPPINLSVISQKGEITPKFSITPTKGVKKEQQESIKEDYYNFDSNENILNRMSLGAEEKFINSSIQLAEANKKIHSGLENYLNVSDSLGRSSKETKSSASPTKQSLQSRENRRSNQFDVFSTFNSEKLAEANEHFNVIDLKNSQKNLAQKNLRHPEASKFPNLFILEQRRKTIEKFAFLEPKPNEVKIKKFHN